MFVLKHEFLLSNVLKAKYQKVFITLSLSVTYNLNGPIILLRQREIFRNSFSQKLFPNFLKSRTVSKQFLTFNIFYSNFVRSFAVI
jgi:hypothetical protein